MRIKFFLRFALLCLWLSAILTPSIITLIDGTSVMVVNINEEEQQEQGEEPQAEEKIAKDANPNTILLSDIKKTTMEIFFLHNHKDHFIEILLPPPERRI